MTRSTRLLPAWRMAGRMIHRVSGASSCPSSPMSRSRGATVSRSSCCTMWAANDRASARESSGDITATVMTPSPPNHATSRGQTIRWRARQRRATSAAYASADTDSPTATLGTNVQLSASAANAGLML
jgi:hypothetical protein